MKHSKYLIFGGVMIAVIVVFVFVLLIIKSKSKSKSKSQKDTFLVSKCVKNPMTFPDTNAKQCVVSTTGTGKPSYILFIRHCDRGYPSIPSNKPYLPQPPSPGNEIRKTCSDPTTECEGCLYEDIQYGCSSNLCSPLGIERSWALGKWIDCFAKSKNLHIAAVISQSKTKDSNSRPQTTASIILDSLMNIGRNPCYLFSNRGDFASVKKQVFTPGFKDQVVVVVWDHGQLGSLINAVTGVPISNKNIHWDPCCFDQVVVIDTSVNPTIGATAYNARSLINDGSDKCGTTCVGQTPYPNCSFGNFDTSHPTVC